MKLIYVFFIFFIFSVIMFVIITLPNGYVNKGEKKYPKIKMCPCDTTDKIHQIY